MRVYFCWVIKIWYNVYMVIMVTLHYSYIHICNGMPDGMFYKSIIFIFTYPSQKESKENICFLFKKKKK